MLLSWHREPKKSYEAVLVQIKMFNTVNIDLNLKRKEVNAKATTDDMTECPIPFTEVVSDKIERDEFLELMLQGMHGVVVKTKSLVHEGSQQIFLSKNQASWKQQVAEMERLAQRWLAFFDQ